MLGAWWGTSGFLSKKLLKKKPRLATGETVTQHLLWHYWVIAENKREVPVFVGFMWDLIEKHALAPFSDFGEKSACALALLQV
jgi:hypothetical protein